MGEIDGKDGQSTIDQRLETVSREAEIVNREGKESLEKKTG